jgi:hypothetical protein
MNFKVKLWALLPALCYLAHAQLWTSSWTNGGSPLVAGVQFETRAEPASPAPTLVGGSNGRLVYRGQTGYSAIHRYFHDDRDLTYAGYDLLIEQDTQPDTFQVTFLELGIGPLDFALGGPTAGGPMDWKKLPPPELPKARVAHAGDKIDVTVWTDPNTGQKLVDTVQILQPPPGPRFPGMLRSSVMAAPRAPAIPTVEGTARDFSAEDVEMHLVQPRVTVNGAQEATPIRAGQGATGTLLWFYLPQRGRFILSLAPRRELGFAKAGEVRGGYIRFKMEGDAFVLESYTAIAPGNAPYTLYVLHDREWTPTAASQAGHFLSGSVSPVEIAALRKK